MSRYEKFKEKYCVHFTDPVIVGMDNKVLYLGYGYVRFKDIRGIFLVSSCSDLNGKIYDYTSSNSIPIKVYAIQIKSQLTATYCKDYYIGFFTDPRKAERFMNKIAENM